MAGVGFELKKLFHEQGLAKSIKAYAYSSLTTVGPIALCMLMIIGMQSMMAYAGSPYMEKELFLATIVYAFIFSVLLTGGLSMILTRFIADMMFLKKYEHLLSSFYGSCAVCLPIGGITAWIFLYNVPAALSYKCSAYIFFAELIIICLGSVHLSAVKDYKRIVRNYLIGVSISFGGVWLIFTLTPYRGTTTVLSMIDIGFFILILLMVRHFEQRFPEKDSSIFFHFLSYLKKYPALFFIGTFLYSGVYTHSFVYWSGANNLRIAEKFVLSPFYDTPVFYAYLTVVPTLVTFVVSVETSFYEKFRDYYSHILSDGTIMEISRAKEEMQKTLMQEISFLMEVQLLFTVISIALGIKLLPMIGFTYEQLFTFNILTLGYYLFIVAFILMLLLLYFDDRKGVVWLSGLFILLNAGFSYWFMIHENHGMGMFVSSLLILIAALGRLMMYVNRIDYYTFCSQPIVAVARPPFWKRWKIWTKFKPTAGILLVILLLTACTDNPAASPASEPAAEPAVASVSQPTELKEDKRLYERDKDTSVSTFYVTILPNPPKKDKYTWYDMNRISSIEDERDLRIIVQEGAPDGSGPTSGSWNYSTTSANAKISLRGNSSRYRAQRSYKIKLNDQTELWHDQKVINLNKHFSEPTRMANKISFDIFEEMNNITSLRTQFVHLYVKDLSEGADTGIYLDYGLYTHVEQPNETFLKSHWLDPYGQLYKAKMFEFFRYDKEIVSEKSPEYDKAKFETRLEIQGREEHGKLIAMLKDLNDFSIPINDVMEKHFNVDNYLIWVASNILMDNMDTSSQNFLLYSPLNSNKWYFLPWDYDGSWEQPRTQNINNPYRNGISNYWGSILHQRFFSMEENVMKLKDKIDELYSKHINYDLVMKRAEAYRGVVEPFLQRSPDIQFFPIPISEYGNALQTMANTPLNSMQRFKEDLEKPRPIFLGNVEKSDTQLKFNWSRSFDLQKDDISYDWIIAEDPLFTTIIDQKSGLLETSVAINLLPEGDYYWKVIIHDNQGHSQIPFDTYRDEDGNKHFGVRQVKVE